MAEKKTILITGATGLIGRPLCEALGASGHRTRTLSRGKGGDFQWDPAKGELPPEAVDGVDAVVHLAGESVAQRWSAEVKRRILKSRTESTQLLARRILETGDRPDFISASGINYYGYDRDLPVDESSSSGEGFLAEVCRQWEAAARPLEEAGCRCVFLRTGVVLSARGGALAKMLPPFKAGAGGRIGDGKQAMSWIALHDLVRLYVECLENYDIAGPVNAVAPEPVTNRQFTKTLGKVIGRPTFIPVPALAIRTLFGEMGKETVLSNLAVKPKSLQELDFRWDYPNLEAALSHTLNQ
ncbi:MAG TPA: TIGR01777 family oxidoreductase [Opitutales bacterium]|nr:TIGR01777 family oxidoreductase [Opitutales bacterium]